MGNHLDKEGAVFCLAPRWSYLKIRGVRFHQISTHPESKREDKSRKDSTLWQLHSGLGFFEGFEAKSLELS